MSHAPSSRVAWLEDVIANVRAADLTDRRRQEMVSAIRTVARAVGREPRAIEADLRTLSIKLRSVSPLALGITPARWSNAKSLLRAAFALLGPMLKGRSQTPMSAEWAALHAKFVTRSDRIKLSRLLRWLSELCIAPAVVTAQHLEEFHSLLVERALLKNAQATWIDVMRAWNRSAGKVEGWPQVTVATREPDPRSYTLPWSAFPKSLKQDVNAWLLRLSGADFADDGPTKPLSAVTLRAQEFYMRAFASALVLRGRDVADLVSIAACCTLANFTEGLRFFHERFGGKPNPTVARMATTMKAVAKHWAKVDDDTLKRMAEITRRLAVPLSGLTERNRKRLQPFNDAEATQRLLSLPRLLRDEIERGKHSRYHANVLGQMAVAIEILIFAPLRIKNLAALEKLLINIPAAELKTRRADLDFELPEESADLIRWYVGNIRRASPDDRFLFPGANSSHKSTSTLRIQITTTVLKYTGLRINPHLFRHIGAKLFLDVNPGAYEVMRRVFGHASIDSTTRAYTGFETGAATRQFDATIAKLRTGIPAGSQRSKKPAQRQRNAGADIR